MREANPGIVDDLGYAPYPSVNGGPPKVTLGGMNYAISTYSKHPAEAFEAAMCLRNAEDQLSAPRSTQVTCRRSPRSSNAEFKKAYPMDQAMLTELKNAVPRPVSPVYQNISTMRVDHAVAARGDQPAGVGRRAAHVHPGRHRWQGDPAVTATQTPTPAAAEAVEDAIDDGTTEIARQRSQRRQEGRAQARADAGRAGGDHHARRRRVPDPLRASGSR